MLCRIGEVEKLAADNSKGVKRHSEKLEHHSHQLGSHSKELECHSNQLGSHSSQLESHSNELKHLTKKLKKEDDVKQKENYSQFAEKKGIYLFALKHDKFIMHFTTAHLG